jgi:hypothetical protein
MKVHREWRISGDTEWLRKMWPKVKESLNYCIETWDPAHKGIVEEPHHNTYDIEFWGPDGMCTSFYLGALSAAVAMGKAAGDTVALAELLEKGLPDETELFDGEYFIQRLNENLRAKTRSKCKHGGQHTPEARSCSKGRTEISIRPQLSPTGCSVRGWRWSAAWARWPTRRKSRATSRQSTNTTSGATSPRTPIPSAPATPAATKVAC